MISSVSGGMEKEKLYKIVLYWFSVIFLPLIRVYL